MARRKAPIEKIEGFSERLKDCRKAVGYSMDDIANELNISKSAYRNYEIGKSEPCLSDLIKMSSIFGESVNFLLGIGTESETPIQSKNRRVIKLQSLIEKTKHASNRRNADKIKNLIDKTLDEFNSIIEKNIDSIINYSAADKNLAKYEDFFNDINALFEGNQPKKNPYNMIELDYFIPYETLVLLSTVLKIFNEYIDFNKQSYTTENDVYGSLFMLKKRFEEVQEKLEGNICAFALDKVTENNTKEV